LGRRILLIDLEEKMNLIEFESKNEYSASIKVIGVGGGGTNAVNSMLRSKAMGVEFIVANTDIQSLEASLCEDQIQLGGSLMRGLGAGASPETGQLAAQESEEHIRAMVGAAPVPVPPPIPAVINTMSDPSSILRMCSSLS
jgi:cell division protein FtsZ